MSGRHCRICGAPISENNPDGIGFQCREVWNRATWSAYYNFRGLEAFKIKIGIWIPAFIAAFEKTKFRSEFKKSFFASVSDRHKQGLNLSGKQLNIVKEMLVGGEITTGKFSPAQIDEILDREKSSIQSDFQSWKNALGEAEREYILNCSKKYYSETSGKAAA